MAFAEQRSPRTEMIRSAAELIARHGVSGTSIGEVLAAADAPRGSVYYHFPGGRAQLMAEAVRYAGEELGAELNRARRLPLSDAVAALAGIWRRRLLDSGFVAGCPVAAGAQARDTDPAAADAAAEVFLQWTHLLSARFREEDYGDRRAEQLADAVLGGIEGAVVLCRARASIDPLDTVVDHLRELLERRVAPTADRSESTKMDTDVVGATAEGQTLG